MRKYDYVAWEEEGTWTVHSPSVPGVWGLGATRAEAEADFTDALNETLTHLVETGKRLPKQRHVTVGVVEVD